MIPMIPMGILAAFCVYLMVDKHIERTRSTRRESELLNRIMTRDYFQYVTGEAMKEEAKHPQPESEIDAFPVV